MEPKLSDHEVERRIEYLRDELTGEGLIAQEFFSRPEKEIFEVRRTLIDCNRNNEIRIVCAFCSQPVYIAGTLDQSYYFKHYKERGDCPIKTKGRLTQDEIDKYRYHGQREGPDHIRLKEFVYHTLLNDPQCSDVRKEAITRSSIDPSIWRKPDVSCNCRQKKLVFEIQLSTTFLNVIAEREEHYRREGVFIIWLFKSFDIVNDRFVQKDIYYSNHV